MLKFNQTDYIAFIILNKSPSVFIQILRDRSTAAEFSYMEKLALPGQLG